MTDSMVSTPSPAADPSGKTSFSSMFLPYTPTAVYLLVREVKDAQVGRGGTELARQEATLGTHVARGIRDSTAKPARPLLIRA